MMTMDFLKTNNGTTGAIARLTIGLVLFPHGAQKLLGWWGGHGFTGTIKYFTATVHLPYLIGALVILIEFFCPLLLVIGVFTRIAAFAIMIVMAGVIATVQHKYFFMNWFGAQQGEGAEFFLLMIGLCLISFREGGGRFSIDQFISTRL